MRPISCSRRPAMTFQSSSVSLPQRSRSWPFHSFQFPAIRSHIDASRLDHAKRIRQQGEFERRPKRLDFAVELDEKTLAARFDHRALEDEPVVGILAEPPEEGLEPHA